MNFGVALLEILERAKQLGIKPDELEAFLKGYAEAAKKASVFRTVA